MKLKLQLHHRMLTGGTRLKSLSMREAFVLGAIAKTIATLFTYPLIRAKVLMQASKKEDEQTLGHTLPQVLVGIGKVDGIQGYYKGCGAQLFNTVLKSALLLMTKEQITKYTMRVLYAMRQQAKTTKAVGG